MALLSVAYTTARTMLNDDAAAFWSDAALLPKAQHAHRRLQAKLALNGVAVIRDEGAIVTILALATTMGVNLPTNIIEPINMEENSVGGAESDWVGMELKQFVPRELQSDTLRYWVWENEVIKFLGATVDREVRLFYKGGLTLPTASTDPIGFNLGELYLGPYIAALGHGSLGNLELAAAAMEEANAGLDQIIRIANKGDQKQPVRKRPFSSRLRRGRRVPF